MPQPLKDAISVCKAIIRNGYEAYIINSPLQKKALIDSNQEKEIDICTDISWESLEKIFPNVSPPLAKYSFAHLKEGETIFHFYNADTLDASYPEAALARLTPRLLKKLEARGELSLNLACPYIPRSKDAFDGFETLDSGQIAFKGIADETLKRDYLLAVRALRFSANYQMPIETNTWLAIVRAARRVVDYVSVVDIMDEWRKVEAENMWQFVQLLFDSMILHGLIPELAALSRVKHIKNPEEGEETVFEHTIEVMKRYPEELPYDWYGTLACLFHDVGKLYTAEEVDGQLTFYQHHQIGAKVTRKILRRLGFPSEDIDLICHLVKHHMRFHFMLTDKGIRRFKGLDEYPRLIEMVRADLKARNGSYREFNHNLKMLERAEISEELLEPLLNGHQIMEYTGIKPGPLVGVIRDELLQAQIRGDVNNLEEAVEFVRSYATKEKLS
ncbi:poly(A) polymerase [Desulfonauticus submarinus]|uniref:Poly(A) polymerase n=1 Tax=Desulfonauticus submarinus TaxID=206665 RepID=A0A1H0D700_9BACT|nr:HD domain-containing protein [Desulfonauticus submarinus]SDN65933.1 poly(A) polymerase [Desulfonauticus submarinus]